MEIREVLPTGYYMYTEDVEYEERLRMNQFFKEKYGFEFKNVNGKTFNVQLQNALYKTHDAVDIIIEMARAALKGKNHDSWHDVINYL